MQYRPTLFTHHCREFPPAAIVMTDHRLLERFRGYICQDFSAEEEKADGDDDDEEEEVDFDDQDLDAVTAGALHVQPKKPPYRKGLLCWTVVFYGTR